MSETALGAFEDCAWWFGRFRVKLVSAEKLLFRDSLMTGSRWLPVDAFRGLAPRDRNIAFFRCGFMVGAMSAAMKPVVPRPRHSGDVLFWQYPCRTEAAAWDLHADLIEPLFVDNSMHVYLGLPWATWIDKWRKEALCDEGSTSMKEQLKWIGVRLSGWKHALGELGVHLKVHTVCQHVEWRDLLPAWQRLGVTDLWLSHCPAGVQAIDVQGPALHPWRLFAVNVEDPSRRQGLHIGRDPEARAVLASFVGAHADAYLSDVRLRLRALADKPGFVVRITERWHFEDVVYRHQILNHPMPVLDDSADAVAGYNALLSDSVFSLCPSGAGPNTLRLWESLAVGTVPVLLGVQPELPRGGTLDPIDWDSIVLRVTDDQLPGLPQRLRSIPMDEVRRRQRLGMEAFALVQQQRCF